MSIVSLTVNGRPQRADVELDSPLLYVLRDNLGLGNPRFGCGLGQCGACTVLVNGDAIRIPSNRRSSTSRPFSAATA
jgi:aerobic-type carbon monoxide dehydrogenase small subunit (CoxS/CutS family)